MAWTLRDLNPRPRDYKSRALTTELRVQVLLRIIKNSVPILRKSIVGLVLRDLLC